MKRPFIALAIAEIFSITGSRLAAIAVPWLVLVTTGDPVLTGLAALFEMLPYVLAKGLSGPLIDRLGQRRIAVTCDMASALVIGLVPLLHWLDLLAFPLLLPIVFVVGMLRGPSDAAKVALTPAVAELAGVPLERVAGVNAAIERTATTAGLAASGALIALVGASEVLVLNTIAFLIAAAFIQFGIPKLPPPAPQEQKPSTYWQDLRAGWDFLRRDSVLVALMMMVAVTNLLDQAYGAVLVPVWVQQHGHGPEILGLLFATFTGASVFGAGIAAALAEKLPRLLVYTLAFVITGLPRFLIFAVDTPLWAMLGVLVVGGFACGFINPVIGVVMIERIPKAMIGRATALSGAIFWILIPFGGLVGGALITWFGLSAAMWTVGVAYLAATLIPLVIPSFRKMNKTAAA
jgi:MFS family permease